MSFKNFFQKIEKTIDDVIFSVSVLVLVSNFAGLGLEAKIEIETGLGLGLGLEKILRSRSWSRTSRSRLQPWFIAAVEASDKEAANGLLSRLRV